MITLQEVESKGATLWSRYCLAREQEAQNAGKPVTFWVTCRTKGPIRPQEVFGTKDPAAVQKIWAKFLGWCQEQKEDVLDGTLLGAIKSACAFLPVKKDELINPNPPEPAPVIVQYNTLLGTINAACAKVPNLHPVAKKAVKKLLAGLNVYLWGPAGSGKSYMCQQIAGILSEVLAKPIAFRDQQVTGPNFSEIDYLVKIMPNEDGSLRSIPSPLVTGAKGDSLVLVDEVDLATGEANVGGLNTPLASRRIFDVLAGETIDIGPDFFFIAAGNTDLNGPTPEYPTRCPQDGSFKSRFATSRFWVGYNEELESKILDPRIAKLLSEARKRIAGKGIELELSTRIGANLTKEIRAGLQTYAEVLEDWFASMDQTARQQAFPQGAN